MIALSRKYAQMNVSTPAARKLVSMTNLAFVSSPAIAFIDASAAAFLSSTTAWIAAAFSRTADSTCLRHSSLAPLVSSSGAAFQDLALDAAKYSDA